MYYGNLFVSLSSFVAYVLCLNAFLFFFIDVCFVLILINITTHCWLVCPYFGTFLPITTAVLCSHIIVKIMKLYSNVMQVKGLTIYKWSHFQDGSSFGLSEFQIRDSPFRIFVEFLLFCYLCYCLMILTNNFVIYALH